MKFFYKNGMLSVTLLLALTFLLIYITEHYILTVGFYQNNGDPLSGMPGTDVRIYDALQKWVYFSSAAYLLLKIAAIALILHTALYLNNHEIDYYPVFKITVLAEFLFLIPAAAKVILFRYTFENGTLLDWHKFYVLSALNIFDAVPADWFYALQSFNAFEIGYWFLLGYGIAAVTGLSFDRSLKLVMISYVPALFIWIATVTFLTLMMFPATG